MLLMLLRHSIPLQVPQHLCQYSDKRIAVVQNVTWSHSEVMWPLCFSIVRVRLLRHAGAGCMCIVRSRPTHPERRLCPTRFDYRCRVVSLTAYGLSGPLSKWTSVEQKGNRQPRGNARFAEALRCVLCLVTLCLPCAIYSIGCGIVHLQACHLSSLGLHHDVLHRTTSPCGLSASLSRHDTARHDTTAEHN